jgi:hypothetical protein
MTINAALHAKPWYREPWPWFLISLPAAAVIAGLATAWLAVQSADGLVVGDYYKAGLAINQTLARDNAARDLALAATFAARDGHLTVNLSGRLLIRPDPLLLTLAHPTHSGGDRHLRLQHIGDGDYRAALPALANGKWHAQLTDASASWRLAGVLHTPFDADATLAAAPATHPASSGD